MVFQKISRDSLYLDILKVNLVSGKLKQDIELIFYH
jgi:hypothetical protein